MANVKNLARIAKELVAPLKGILAADESLKTMTKRLETIGVESTLENRSMWRQVMVTTEGFEKAVSGIILYDETLRNPLPNGQMIAEILRKKGIMPGIKVDEGVYKFNETGESFTLGLDKLTGRLEEYAKMGAVFAKWRAVYKIGKNIPSKTAVVANSVGLAEYALMVQKAGLVPIVEPEILVLEGDHTIDRSEQITEMVLKDVFRLLKEFGVELDSMLLKPNMVLPGKETVDRPSTQEIARLTVKVLKKAVPPQVPGIVFLSGGLTPDESTEYLKTMNAMYKNLPWQLSYSFGRALQQEGLKAWGGKKANVKRAQSAFLFRARKVSDAREGK